MSINRVINGMINIDLKPVKIDLNVDYFKSKAAILKGFQSVG